MNSSSFFLAQRILFRQVYQKSISTMTMISFIGIFIGSFALALITAIMNGFEVTIHQKMQTIHADIIIQSYRNDINVNVLSKVIENEFPEIKALSPLASHHILLRTDNDSIDETPIVAIIKGIDPDKEQHTTSLPQKIIAAFPGADFPQLFRGNHLIIGKQIARNNQINIGDTIDILFMRNQEIRGKKITFESEKVVVSGIFDTGIDEYDGGVVYSSLDFLEKIYPNIMVDQVNLSLNPGYNEKECIEKLRKRIGLDVYSWKDLYPSLVASLQLEKYVSFIIIALILLVASMNITSLLFMHITQKRSHIALLKAIGMTDSAIKQIFFIMGLTLSCIGAFTGLCASLAASCILKNYPFITLPDTYYVTHLPVAMSFEIIVAVFCIVILFSLAATWIATRSIKSINISHVLRFEG